MNASLNNRCKLLSVLRVIYFYPLCNMGGNFFVTTHGPVKVKIEIVSRLIFEDTMKIYNFYGTGLK